MQGLHKGPIQRESGVVYVQKGDGMLREERACGSGRQVAGLWVAGDLACACPGQLGQAAVPCPCFPFLAFS